ncbi:hypothetical protein F5879DRAFT_319235 [Lentinula edodes]|nr:hypothetical protein F5879DRAFT_319235 [Lentinula edodes]
MDEFSIHTLVGDHFIVDRASCVADTLASLCPSVRTTSKAVVFGLTFNAETSSSLFIIIVTPCSRLASSNYRMIYVFGLYLLLTTLSTTHCVFFGEIHLVDRLINVSARTFPAIFVEQSSPMPLNRFLFSSSPARTGILVHATSP